MNDKLSKIILQITKERKKKRISQSKMAEDCGVNRKTIYLFETMRLKDVSAGILFKYCESLGIEVELFRRI